MACGSDATVGDPSIIGKTDHRQRSRAHRRRRAAAGHQVPADRSALYAAALGRVSRDRAATSTRVALLEAGPSRSSSSRSELSAIAKRLEEQYPVTNRGFGVQVVPIRRSYVGAGGRPHGRHPDDGGWFRPADHVREPGQPDAGARRITPARAGRAVGDGRQPRPIAVGRADRECLARGARHARRPDCCRSGRSTR